MAYRASPLVSAHYPPDHQFPSNPICQPTPFQNKAFLLKSAPSVSAACKLDTWETERGNGRCTAVWPPVRLLRSKTGSGQYFVDLRTNIQMQMWQTVSGSYWLVKRKMCVYHSLDFSRSIHFQRMKYGTFLEFPGGLGRFLIFGRIQACLGLHCLKLFQKHNGLENKMYRFSMLNLILVLKRKIQRSLQGALSIPKYSISHHAWFSL